MPHCMVVSKNHGLAPGAGKSSGARLRDAVSGVVADITAAGRHLEQGTEIRSTEYAHPSNC